MGCIELVIGYGYLIHRGPVQVHQLQADRSPPGTLPDQERIDLQCEERRDGVLLWRRLAGFVVGYDHSIGSLLHTVEDAANGYVAKDLSHVEFPVERLECRRIFDQEVVGQHTEAFDAPFPLFFRVIEQVGEFLVAEFDPRLAEELVQRFGLALSCREIEQPLQR